MKGTIKEDKFAESKRILLDLNSAKNEDVVVKILKRDKTKHAKVIDFICDAVRAFGTNSNNLNVNDIEKMMDEMMEQKLKNINVSVDLDDENININESLEDNIARVDCEED